MKYLEDYQVGQSMRSEPYEVTSAEITEFAKKWDPQPFHTDEELARQSFYGGLTACSAHIFAVYTGLSTRLPQKTAAIAGLGFDELRVLQPLRAGDAVYLTTECLEVRRSRTKPDRGIVRSRGTLFNRKDEPVFSMISTFMVRCRDAEVQLHE